jgi:hypothetical protein
MPPRMIVAVETINEANIKVRPTLPNKRAGERICAWISANNSQVWLNRPLTTPKKAMPM